MYTRPRILVGTHSDQGARTKGKPNSYASNQQISNKHISLQSYRSQMSGDLYSQHTHSQLFKVSSSSNLPTLPQKKLGQPQRVSMSQVSSLDSLGGGPGVPSKPQTSPINSSEAASSLNISTATHKQPVTAIDTNASREEKQIAVHNLLIKSDSNNSSSSQGTGSAVNKASFFHHNATPATTPQAPPSSSDFVTAPTMQLTTTAKTTPPSKDLIIVKPGCRCIIM